MLTDAELTEIRYSGRGVLTLRVLKAIYYGTIINCVVMAMVLVAAIRIAEVFLPWHEWLSAGFYDVAVSLVTSMNLVEVLGRSVTELAPAVAATNNFISILAILAFTALYSMTGGLRSVVATDVMQFGLAMIGTLAYGWIVINEAGGLGGPTDRIVELYGPDLAGEMLSFGPPDLSGEALLPFLTIIGLQWFFQMNSDGTGYLAQRSMACKTDRDARTAGVVFAWAQILFRSLIWLLIGVGMGSVLALRWLWERINLYSELAAIVASLITAPLLLVFMGTDPDTEWIRLGTMALVTTAAAVGITFFTPSTSRRVLLSFYKRVRPLGFWSKTASALGDRPAAPRQALWRRLRSLTLTALSLFLLLVGLGRLMIPPPEGSALFTWGCTLTGLTLIPFWWHDAVVRDELVVDRRAEQTAPAPGSAALEGPA